MRAAVERAWAEANRIQNAKAELLRQDLRWKEEAQTDLARSISMASPLADFSYLATDLSSTGIRNMLHFSKLSGLWDGSFGDYAKKKTADMKAKDPTADLSNSAVDMTDSPRFHYTEEALGGRVRAALSPFAVLLGYCVVLIAAGFAAFVRYDVR
jgi:broad specificity phosphatase PhoE